MNVAFFDYLCLPAVELERLDGEWEGLAGRQWRCEYVPPAIEQATPTAVQRALSVLDKVIARGHVTFLSSELEETLSKRQFASAGE